MVPCRLSYQHTPAARRFHLVQARRQLCHLYLQPGFLLLHHHRWSSSAGITEPVQGGVEAGLRLGLGKAQQDTFYTDADNIVRRKLEVEVQADEDETRAARRQVGCSEWPHCMLLWRNGCTSGGASDIPRLWLNNLAAQHCRAELCGACDVPSGCCWAVQALGSRLAAVLSGLLRGSFRTLLVLHHEQHFFAMGTNALPFAACPTGSSVATQSSMYKLLMRPLPWSVCSGCSLEPDAVGCCVRTHHRLRLPRPGPITPPFPLHCVDASRAGAADSPGGRPAAAHLLL